MQANVHVGAYAGSQSPPHTDTGGTNGSTEHVHEPPPANMESGEDMCSSLEEWLHALPIIEELEVGFFSRNSFFPFSYFLHLRFTGMLQTTVPTNLMPLFPCIIVAPIDAGHI